MRRTISLVLFVLVVNSAAFAQAVPEGVHNDATGPSDVCGISGPNALAIRDALRGNPTIAERLSGSARFETYFSLAEAKQWTVTTDEDRAYPAVTCVHLFNSGKGTDMRREMRCDATRAACDTLFREFEANDREIRRQIRGR